MSTFHPHFEILPSAQIQLWKELQPLKKLGFVSTLVINLIFVILKKKIKIAIGRNKKKLKYVNLIS